MRSERNRAEVTSAIEAVGANNASWLPRETLPSNSDIYRAHIVVAMQGDILAHVEARIGDFFKGQFNEGACRVEQHAREHCETFAAALREEAHRELISV